MNDNLTLKFSKIFTNFDYSCASFESTPCKNNTSQKHSIRILLVSNGLVDRAPLIDFANKTSCNTIFLLKKICPIPVHMDSFNFFNSKSMCILIGSIVSIKHRAFGCH